MKMFFYEGAAPNFGDDLNHWLWSRLLPGFFDGDDSTIFLGIGSIIYDRFPQEAKKVVFGAGYAGYSAAPTIDENWSFYFVRGARTAEKLGLSPELGIGDSGILIRSVDIPSPEKRHDVSFMPHFESAMYGSWQEICEKLGINFIDPRWGVDRVLDNILASKLVVSEAMHGVIISDALRVPWQAILPHDPNHRDKWQDWASPLGVEIDFKHLGPSNGLEWLMSKFWNRRRGVYMLRRRRGLMFRLGFGKPLPSAVSALQSAVSKGQLSSDERIEAATAKMLEKLEQLKRDFPKP
ncbi:polysaccharide pyruvyl transferase family protein [Pseudomonas sp. ODNR1LW]|nr:polysaccharide pyruvyl transferase family protein [Pseudomonas sp. ODNR1LW]